MVIEDQKLQSRVSVEELSHRYVENCIQAYSSAKVLPGAQKLTKYIKENNIPIAICTSSTHKAVEVKKTTDPEMFARFDFFLTGDNPRTFIRFVTETILY